MKVKFFRVAIVLVVCGTAVAACAKRSAPVPDGESAGAAVSESARAPAAAAPPQAHNEAVAQLLSSATTETSGDRQFVRTAHATFRVQDVYAAGLTIEDRVATHGGFVLRNAMNTHRERTEQRPDGQGQLTELAQYALRGELLVRVPAAQTQAFLRGLAPLVAFLDDRTFEATDVQFDLLRKQLAYEREQAAQQELGHAGDAPGKIDDKNDAIRARRDARAARDEAQVGQAEFEDKVAFSTIALSLYQAPKLVTSQVPDLEWAFAQAEPSFAGRAVTALHDGWHTLKDFTIAMLESWPWILIFGGALAIWRWRKKRTTSV